MKKYRRSLSKYYGNNIHMKLALKQHSTKSYQHIVSIVTGLFYVSGFSNDLEKKQRHPLSRQFFYKLFYGV